MAETPEEVDLLWLRNTAAVEQFEQFYLELAAALGARDAVEEVLVERIVICAWR